jgi:hypothetical protein
MGTLRGQINRLWMNNERQHHTSRENIRCHRDVFIEIAFFVSQMIDPGQAVEEHSQIEVNGKTNINARTTKRYMGYPLLLDVAADSVSPVSPRSH